ncbi:MAG: tRNA (adenosine(37)-N6)-threonylcarbamoyltransferase complex ATPase subunit type 1 TsaE [Clostridiales bacterium 43-6]|nr:MAG: tRNA (adenosine(37)-N6)-threonylcarbamoyltransferase complex ATPase subunit type 1 TsaE [Clostridiales bacterium 43-6]
MRLLTHSVKETETLGRRLAGVLKSGDTVALFGDMGAGKTAFVRGIAQGLQYPGEVSSPTFSIVNEYLGGVCPVYHFDMYRIEGWDDLHSIGYYDFLDKDAILIIEWSENIENALPENAIKITVSSGEAETDRIFSFEGVSF